MEEENQGELANRDEHGPGAPRAAGPGMTRPAPSSGLPRAGPSSGGPHFWKFSQNKQIVWPSLQLTVVCTVETRAIQLFIKASQNFREIHYQFSVPASKQLIQASWGALCTQIWTTSVTVGRYCRTAGQAGPKLATGRARLGRKMAWKLRACLKIFGPCTSLLANPGSPGKWPLKWTQQTQSKQKNHSYDLPINISYMMTPSDHQSQELV